MAAFNKYALAAAGRTGNNTHAGVEVSGDDETGEKILTQVDKFMEKGCVFRTFQYAHGYYFPSAIKLREHMRDRYGKAQRSPMIMKNVPPAYTLTWRTKV